MIKINRFHKLFFFIFFLGSNLCVFSQDSKIIEIQQAGSFSKDEFNFPGANILKKENNIRVHLYHEGALIKSNTSFFYPKKNFFSANGDIVFNQGDSLFLNCDQIEYDGKIKKIKAWGNVKLRNEEMKLYTDTLYLDRINNIAFYKTPGKIIDKSSILNSNEGTYFLDEKKYRFIKNVKIKNPEYNLNSSRLDYFVLNEDSFFYGPSKIVGKDYVIYCESGYYNSKIEKGNFKKNAVIHYNNKIIKGDSLYFENDNRYASASKNVKIFDTINNSIIRGDYGEVFKSKDSAIITKNPIAINIIENDSLYIGADTIILTGKDKNRLITAYYDVKILNSDLKGKSDSLSFKESDQLIKLIKKPLTKKENQVLNLNQKNMRNPILWFEKSQLSGNLIHLLTDSSNSKLDSIFIFDNTFIAEEDSLNKNGFNQIKGKNLYGNFENGNLKNIKVDKNTEVIYYMYTEESELIGVNKTICSSIEMKMDNNEIKEITFFTLPDGKVNPEKMIDKNQLFLDGFTWRINEMPKNVNDLNN